MGPPHQQGAQPAQWRDPQQWADQSAAPFWLMPLKGARHRLENLAAAIEGGRLPADLQAEARQAIASGRSKPHAAPLAAPQR
jgi:hypothetical protein